MDTPNPTCRIAIVMGSQSDWPTMKGAADILESLDIPFTSHIISAHRTPDRLYAFGKQAEGAALSAIIAGAGGAAHLPGMLAALTPVPILGVPVTSRALSGLDSLYSIVQMPAGIPVATFAIGEAGAKNAALFAAAMLPDTDTRNRLKAWRTTQSAQVATHPT